MYYVYAIKNNASRIYIGHTNDLIKRIRRHNSELISKKTSYTYKQKGPWKLVYKEGYKTRQEAIKREKELKSYQGRIFIKRVASSTVEQMPLKH